MLRLDMMLVANGDINYYHKVYVGQYLSTFWEDQVKYVVDQVIILPDFNVKIVLLHIALPLSLKCRFDYFNRIVLSVM